MSTSTTERPGTAQAVERAILAILLADNRRLEHIAPFLEPKHFCSEQHQHIYRIIKTRIERHDLANVVTLEVEMASVDALGGRATAYLTDLVESFDRRPETMDCIVGLARTVRQTWLNREAALT